MVRLRVHDFPRREAIILYAITHTGHSPRSTLYSSARMPAASPTLDYKASGTLRGVTLDATGDGCLLTFPPPSWLRQWAPILYLLYIGAKSSLMGIAAFVLSARLNTRAIPTAVVDEFFWMKAVSILGGLTAFGVAAKAYCQYRRLGKTPTILTVSRTQIVHSSRGFLWGMNHQSWPTTILRHAEIRSHKPLPPWSVVADLRLRLRGRWGPLSLRITTHDETLLPRLRQALAAAKITLVADKNAATSRRHDSP